MCMYGAVTGDYVNAVENTAKSSLARNEVMKIEREKGTRSCTLVDSFSLF